MWNMKVIIQNRYWCFWYNQQRFIRGTGGLGIRRTSEDHPNYYIIENGQNTRKNPGDLRRHAVTQTQVKNSQEVNTTTNNNNRMCTTSKYLNVYRD